MQRLLVWLAATFAASTAAGCGVSAIAGTLVALSSDKGSSSSQAVAPPVVEAVSPAAGSHAGGSIITITGRSFPADATVSVGGITAARVTAVDPRTLTVVTPYSSRSGEVDVVVTGASSGSGTLARGFAYTNELPSIVITPFGGPQSQHIVVSFVVRDAEHDPVHVHLEVDTGAGFEPIAEDEIVSGAVTLLASSPGGTKHAITFDSRTLFPAQDATGVRLRITPFDLPGHDVPGLPGVSTAFEVVNNTPVIVDVVQPGRDAFHVVFTYEVTDPDEGHHGARVTELRWLDQRSGSTGLMTVASGQGLGPVACSAAGSLSATVWDSFADLGFGNDRLVTVSVTVDDAFTSATATTQPFFVSNGPLGEPEVLSFAGTTEAMAVDDVDGDGRPDVAVSGYAGVSFSLNLGRRFAAGTGAAPRPPLPPTAPPFPGVPTYNPFMATSAAAGPVALLDLDGDQRLDLVTGEGPFAPTSLTPLQSNPGLALFMANADADSGYVHVIGHHALLLAPTTAPLGRPDVAAGTWESAQAPIASVAPHLFTSGSSAFVATPTGDPALDRVGWFLQSLTAAELDAPATDAPPNDLVILHGLHQLGRATAGDFRGVVVLRQTDPDTGRLAPPVYLDPTDMGELPTSLVVADLLGPARAEGAWGEVASAPVGTPDLVVACRGDSSLTFYFQLDVAVWPAPGAPRFASLRLPMSAVNPGTPLGDVSGVAVGDLNGDSWNDVVVAGTLSGTITVLLHDTDPTAPGSLLPLTAGRLPLRRAAVLDLGSRGLAAPAIADMNGDGTNDILVPMTLFTELRLLVGTGLDDGAPQFTSVRLSMPHQVFELLSLDLDGDTRADCLARSYVEVSASYQTSPGTLDERFVPIATGTSPQLLRVGDVLGLGSPQVVCPSAGDGTVQVFGRDALTTLRLAAQFSIVAPPGSPTQLYAPADTVLADVTGDGAPDISVLLRHVIRDDVGSGTGFALVPSPLAGATVGTIRTTGFQNDFGIGIAGGDLDGDGHVDLAVASVSGGFGGVSIFTGGGSELPLLTTRSVPYAGLGCEVRDLDGDGFSDVVVGCSQVIAVFYGSPTGLSMAPSLIGANCYYVETADLDGDGRLDLVVTDSTRTDVQVCYQTAPRTFTVVRLVGGHQCQQPAVGDLDGDGRLDLAVPWGQESVVAVYHQRADATGPADRFATPILYPTGSGPMGCVIVDVDGDLRDDVVVSSRGTSALNVFVQR